MRISSAVRRFRKQTRLHAHDTRARVVIILKGQTLHTATGGQDRSRKGGGGYEARTRGEKNRMGNLNNHVRKGLAMTSDMRKNLLVESFFNVVACSG